MTTLITGVPGWLSSRLLNRIMGEAKDIRCLVLPGFEVPELDISSVEIVRADLRDPSTLSGVCDDVDAVFHLAAVIHPREREEFYRVNAEGTRSLLEVARKAGVKKFISVSSDTAAGANISRGTPMTEDHAPEPRGDYGKSKLIAEQLVCEAYTEHGMRTTVLRPCVFYGPGCPPRWHDFFDMIRQGRVPMFGGGKNLRSMTYIENMVDALLLAEKTKGKGKVYWVADKEPYSVREFYSSTAEALGVPLRYIPAPSILSRGCFYLDSLLSKAGLHSYVLHVLGEQFLDITVDVSRAEKELGYCPQVSLQMGMRAAVGATGARARGR